jgi:hypothetical protein
MWTEICLTLLVLSSILNNLIALAKFHKDYLEDDSDTEPMPEEAKRMFS